MAIRYTNPDNIEFSSIEVSGKEKDILEEALMDTTTSQVSSFESFASNLEKAKELKSKE